MPYPGPHNSHLTFEFQTQPWSKNGTRLEKNKNKINKSKIKIIKGEGGWDKITAEIKTQAVKVLIWKTDARLGSAIVGDKL